VIKRDDGGYSVQLREPVDIVQDGPNRWRVVPSGPAPEGFDVGKLLEDSTARFVTYVRRNAVELIKVGQALVAGVARGIFMLFMTLMVSAYLMLTRESILAFFKSLLPRRQRPEFERLLWRIDRGFSGVVRGQLIICVINGVLSALGFWLFGLKYWPVLAVVASVLSIIPIFGAILSSVPAVMIGLTQSFWTALSVLGWIVVVHQIEANVLNPKIIGVSAKIHPVLVVFSLVLGEHLYGLWGALLAVPALSFVQSVFNHFRFESMPDVPPDSIYHQARTPPAP
jgi:predicted PurR-regulated permease PerM